MHSNLTSSVTQNAGADSVPLVPEAALGKRTPSKGEKLFDQIVYGGIAGVGTFISTLWITYGLTHGHQMKGRYIEVANKFERFLKRFLNDQFSHHAATFSIRTTTLMMGGNAMVIPVGIAEHFKVPLVDAFNKQMGDPTRKEDVAEAPKQTWMSIIKGRLAAWGIVFGAMIGISGVLPGTYRMFKHEFGKRAYQFTRLATGGARLTEEGMQATRSYRVGEIAADDVFATAASTSLLYTFGHLFARKQQQHKQVKEVLRKHGVPLASDEPSLTDTQAKAAAPAQMATAAAALSPTSRLVGDRRHEGLQHAHPVQEVVVG